MTHGRGVPAGYGEYVTPFLTVFRFDAQGPPRPHPNGEWYGCLVHMQGGKYTLALQYHAHSIAKVAGPILMFVLGGLSHA